MSMVEERDLKMRCMKEYRHYFLDEVEKICPVDHNITRKKRFVFAAIASLFIFAVASAGIGTSMFATHKTDQLEISDVEMKRTMNDLAYRVNVLTNNQEILEKHVEQIASTINKLIDSQNKVKTEVEAMQFVLSFLAAKLDRGQEVLRLTKKLWDKRRMDDGLFNYLNFTMPCADLCPIELGEFNSCQLSDKKDRILMKFLVPEVDTNLTLVSADDFTLLVRQQEQTCRLSYTGPTNALLSIREDCIYDTGLGARYRGQIFLTAQQKCKTKAIFTDVSDHFSLSSCRNRTNDDAADFVQVKAFNGKYYIYCPDQQFVLGNNRKANCPNHVFTLPISSTFTINNVTYFGKSLDIVFHEVEDPQFIDKVEWHLTPHLKWDTLNETFKNVPYMAPPVWTTVSESSSTTIWYILGLAALVIAGIALRCACKRWRPTCGRPQATVPKPGVLYNIVKQPGTPETQTTGLSGSSSSDEDNISFRITLPTGSTTSSTT
jgi:hypothetical protein